MNKLKLLGLLAIVAPLIGCNSQSSNYIDVASYVDSTGQRDCSDKIQELINNNPHRTLYFRDGTYLLDHQIATPGDPDKAVDLRLSNFAILKASDKYKVTRDESKTREKWQDKYLYMVSLGGLDRENHVEKVCSHYSLTGGIIDGSGIAAGIEVAGGRETRVQDASLRNVQVGVRIAPGVNGGGSSDADLRDLSIICNDKTESYGLRIDGWDNSATNIRIGHAVHGVYVAGGTALLKNIHPLNTGECLKEGKIDLYKESVGFEIDGFCELNNCYSDNYRVAYKFNKPTTAFLSDCIAWWWNAGGVADPNHEQICIYRNCSAFNATVNNFVAGFKKRDEQEVVTPYIMRAADEAKIEGRGIISNIRANLLTNNLIKDVAFTNDKYYPADNSILKTYFVDTGERGILPNA